MWPSPKKRQTTDRQLVFPAIHFARAPQPWRHARHWGRGLREAIES